MEPLATNYSPTMVGASFLISFIGALFAVGAARRIVRNTGELSAINTFNASIALGGIGVWAMHFVGMLAMKLPIGHGYSMVETLVSLLAAAAGTAGALVHVARNPTRWGRLLPAGIFLGLGISFMHYLGMYSLRFGGFLAWSLPMVALSVAIAIAAATAALWLVFNTRGFTGTVAAAAAMAGAVCAMHYTGMSAADFICTTSNRLAVPTGFGVVSAWNLPTLVFVAVTWIVVQLGFDHAVHLMRRAGATSRTPGREVPATAAAHR